MIKFMVFIEVSVKNCIKNLLMLYFLELYGIFLVIREDKNCGLGISVLIKFVVVKVVINKLVVVFRWGFLNIIIMIIILLINVRIRSKMYINDFKIISLFCLKGIWFVIFCKILVGLELVGVGEIMFFVIICF